MKSSVTCHLRRSTLSSDRWRYSYSCTSCSLALRLSGRTSGRWIGCIHVDVSCVNRMLSLWWSVRYSVYLPVVLPVCMSVSPWYPFSRHAVLHPYKRTAVKAKPNTDLKAMKTLELVRCGLWKHLWKNRLEVMHMQSEYAFLGDKRTGSRKEKSLADEHSRFVYNWKVLLPATLTVCSAYSTRIPRCLIKRSWSTPYLIHIKC